MKHVQRLLPISVGLGAYLGVAPLRCPGRTTGCSGIVAWDGHSHLNAAIFGVVVAFGVWSIVVVARNWDRIGSAGRITARTLLLCATLLCLASIGGAMAGAFPILLPLVILVTRSSSRPAAALWTILGLLAALEAAFMYSLVFPRGLPLMLSLTFVGVVTATLLSSAISGRDEPRNV